MVVLAVPGRRGVRLEPVKDIRVEVAVDQLVHQVAPVFGPVLDVAPPVRQPAELQPQLVGEGLLPGAHLLLQVRPELGAQGVLGAHVLIAGRLINQRDQADVGAGRQERRCVARDVEGNFSAQRPGIVRPHECPADLQEALRGDAIDLLVGHIIERKFNQLVFQVDPQELMGWLDVPLEVAADDALIGPGQGSERAGARDHAPPVVQDVAGD